MLNYTLNGKQLTKYCNRSSFWQQRKLELIAPRRCSSWRSPTTSTRLTLGRAKKEGDVEGAVLAQCGGLQPPRVVLAQCGQVAEGAGSSSRVLLCTSLKETTFSCFPVTEIHLSHLITELHGAQQHERRLAMNIKLLHRGTSFQKQFEDI